jgi:hypothetical protein
MKDRVAPIHRLSLAVRVVDHFSGEPLAEELPLRLGGSLQRPVLAPGGATRRQADGAYRFINVPEGLVTLLWREPFARRHGGWLRWPDGDPQFALPLPDPAAWAELPLWPAPSAGARPGATGVRGRLVGTGAAGLTVRIAVAGEPFDRYTRSDDNGEFLFLPPGGIQGQAAGRVPLRIEVQAGVGAPRVAAGGFFVPDGAGAAFAGADFTVNPRSVSRIVFRLL